MKKFNKLGSITDMPFKDGEFDFVFETSLCHVAEKRVVKAIRELNRVVKTGLLFGSVTSDMPAALIDRYDLLRGVKKLGTWWEWSELFFGNGFRPFDAPPATARMRCGPQRLPPTRVPASGMPTPIACVIRSSTRSKTTIDDCALPLKSAPW